MVVEGEGVAGEGEGGLEGDKYGPGDWGLSSAFYREPSWRREKRIRMKSGGLDIPSSIDIRPMEEKRDERICSDG